MKHGTQDTHTMVSVDTENAKVLTDGLFALEMLRISKCDIRQINKTIIFVSAESIWKR